VHIWVIWCHIWDTWCHIWLLSLMWYHTWCHLTSIHGTVYELELVIWKDAHVSRIYGTIYELELAKYGTTQMSIPYMAPCMK